MFIKMLTAAEAQRIVSGETFLSKTDKTMLESINMGIDAACKRKETEYVFKMWNVHCQHEKIMQILEEHGYKVTYREDDSKGFIIRYITIKW